MNTGKDTCETAIFAGGCFWCTEAVFSRLEGINHVESGYIGGTIKNPCYREICTGRTGHAEAVRINFDPHRISYAKLLEVFFATHDPTTLNRQGNDVGTQYRSEIFYTNPGQKETAAAYIKFLTESKVFSAPIVTALSEAIPFYLAEDEHRNYYELHGSQPYCQVIISPKVRKLQKEFESYLKK
ncbi:peptide-methionine (S)-S-oxide reductase [Sediminicola luteus]|uniref:Peptide methionine sulfoxide reductase MsrA n=2 Tax=Sediminicola luteus TaxID=319238 RepID=A0A2A4G879_9FLAO|nr:peptide-methionine (S)-S-oxide reductase [Sediminicola luteus]